MDWLNKGAPERRIGIIIGAQGDAQGRVPLLFATSVRWGDPDANDRFAGY